MAALLLIPRSMRRLVWVWVAAHIWAVGPAFSQAEETPGNPTRFSFTASANAVHLNVSVVNKKGKLITDLEQTEPSQATRAASSHFATRTRSWGTSQKAREPKRCAHVPLRCAGPSRA